MFKLKPGNVFQKMNQMDKKQAYTWGAIVVVCFVALITLASFMGEADETSFDGLNTRGYDLAQMPFVNDEAEEYLLASKYPDMQGNNSNMLYSAAEKEARQEEDAKEAEETVDFSESDSSSDSDSGYSSGYSGRGYSGRGGGGSRTPTQVGQLGSASMGHAGGSGVSASWGSPRGDFSTYRKQDKGSETPINQLKTSDARRALSQFAQSSRAAAGFKDGKGANAKRALMGGSVRGSEAFTDGGVDLSKTGGLALDTNAPTSTADLGNLDKAVSDAANKAKDNKKKFDEAAKKSFLQQLGEQLLTNTVNYLFQAGTRILDDQIDGWMANWAGNSALNDSLKMSSDTMYGKTSSQLGEKGLAELQEIHPNIDWKTELADGKKTVGDVWSSHANSDSETKYDRNSFYKGNGTENDRGMRDYWKDNTSSEAYQEALAKKQAVIASRRGSNTRFNDAYNATGPYGQQNTFNMGQGQQCAAGKTWQEITTEQDGVKTTKRGCF